MKIDIDAGPLRRQLYRMTHDIDEAGAEVAQEWADHVQALAVADVRVDTGFLQAHIDKRVSATKMTAQVGVFDKDAYYGTFIERGTESITADPFLEPAAEEGNDRLEEFTRRAIDRHLPG
ncbi:HK97 gp10 family phage protein [Sphaerisporangium sp. NPDC004334]